MSRTKIFGEHEDHTLEQLHDVASRAERAALMADGHLGYIMPIGGVTAYSRRVSVAGVGFDIACGNAAIRTNLTREDLPEEVGELADEIFDRLEFGVGRVNQEDDAPEDHPLFGDDRWGLIPEDHQRDGRGPLKEKARNQLGTIGGGNHYVDVFTDEEGVVWVGVHFGSRGFGHTVASNFLALTKNEPWGTRVKEHEGLVHLDNPIGHDYWHLMNLAGEYAYAGREWVARKVVEILSGEEVELVHNHHNFAWLENHEGRNYVVVRKGATPARPGQKGFVGGTMGEDAVILQGKDNPDGSGEQWLQKQAMYSTVHGAGRVMGRRHAKRTLDEKEVWEWLDEAGVTLRGAGLDEAPQAYKRLPDVLEHQGDTIEVLHRLTPFIVCMAPDDTLDPYKD